MMALVAHEPAYVGCTSVTPMNEDADRAEA